MSIVSISLKDKLLKEMDGLQKELGFSGRSDIVRAGILLLLSEHKEKKNLHGRIKSILLLVHSERAEDVVTRIKHEFNDIIDTQIHTNLQGEKCLEIFILDGEARRIHQLLHLPQANKKIEYVKLIVP